MSPASPAEHLLNKCDNYTQTIQALVCFMHLYRFDDASKSIRTGVRIFQGRRFTPVRATQATAASAKGDTVTPDLAIFSPPQGAVVAEVKQSWPRDRTLWREDVEQILKYDAELLGWPTPDERVPTHDLALLVDIAHSQPVTAFIKDGQAAGWVRFERKFALIEFERKSDRQQFLFLRLYSGDLSDGVVSQTLGPGVKVPLLLVMPLYSECRLYDARPPLPLLMQLIWEDIVADRARKKDEFAALRGNARMSVDITLRQLRQELDDRFSFAGFHRGFEARQGQIPQLEWVRSACEHFVTCRDAEWLRARSGDSVRFRFTKKYKDVLTHFAEVVAASGGAGGTDQLEINLEGGEEEQEAS